MELGKPVTEGKSVLRIQRAFLYVYAIARIPPFIISILLWMLCLVFYYVQKPMPVDAVKIYAVLSLI